MNNTIILKRGFTRLTLAEYKKFNRFDTIAGVDSNPEEIKRWDISDKENALKELKKYNCVYKKYNDSLIDIEEYMLEYCKCDKDGEFIEGSDYEFALIKDEIE